MTTTRRSRDVARPHQELLDLASRFTTGQTQALDTPFGHAGHRIYQWMRVTRFAHCEYSVRRAAPRASITRWPIGTDPGSGRRSWARARSARDGSNPPAAHRPKLAVYQFSIGEEIRRWRNGLGPRVADEAKRQIDGQGNVGMQLPRHQIRDRESPCRVPSTQAGVVRRVDEQQPSHETGLCLIGQLGIGRMPIKTFTAEPTDNAGERSRSSASSYPTTNH